MLSIRIAHPYDAVQAVERSVSVAELMLLQAFLPSAAIKCTPYIGWHAWCAPGVHHCRPSPIIIKLQVPLHFLVGQSFTVRFAHELLC